VKEKIEKAIRIKNFEEFKEIIEVFVNFGEVIIPSHLVKFIITLNKLPLEGKFKRKCSRVIGLHRGEKMELSFIHHLCIWTDARFLEFFFEKYAENKEVIRDITENHNLTTLMNTENPIFQQTPIISVLANGDKEKVWWILNQVVNKKSMKINWNFTDGEGRNILSCLLYNKKLQLKDLYEIFNDYIFTLYKSMIVSFTFMSLAQLFTQVDKNGFVSIVYFLTKVNPKSEEITEELDLFDMIAEKTDFNLIENIFNDDLNNHPLVIWAQCQLSVYFSALLRYIKKSNEDGLLRPMVLWIYIFKFAFRLEWVKIIEQLIKEVRNIETFILDASGGKCITLFDILIEFFESLKAFKIINTEDNFGNRHLIEVLYGKFVQVVYTETKDINIENTAEFIRDFWYFTKLEDCDLGVPAPPVFKIRTIKWYRNLIREKYNKRVEEIKKFIEEFEPKMVNSRTHLICSTFKANAYYSFPYLYSGWERQVYHFEEESSNSCLKVVAIFTWLALGVHRNIFELVYDWEMQNKDLWHLHGDDDKDSDFGEDENEDEESEDEESEGPSIRKITYFRHNFIDKFKLRIYKKEFLWFQISILKKNKFKDAELLFPFLLLKQLDWKYMINKAFVDVLIGKELEFAWRVSYNDRHNSAARELICALIDKIIEVKYVFDLRNDCHYLSFIFNFLLSHGK
jgi:hypothetical protein